MQNAVQHMFRVYVSVEFCEDYWIFINFKPWTDLSQTTIGNLKA